MAELLEIQSEDQLPKLHPAVVAQRAHSVNILANNGLLGAIGGCTLTEQEDIVASEGDQLAKAQEENEGLAVVQRGNVEKQRSEVPAGQPRPYRGLAIKNPLLAMSIIDRQARKHGNVAMEIMSRRHLAFMHRSAFVWGGARNDDLEELSLLAQVDPTVIFGMKNPLDGDIQRTVEIVASIDERRQRIAEKLGIQVAPALVIYRGSDNARTPQAWRDERMEFFEATEGRLIDDVAHGAMRAHHPKGLYDKSVVGQFMAWESLIMLAQAGYIGVGVLSEGSSMRSDVDLNMPFRSALQNLVKLNTIKQVSNVAVAA